MDLYPAPLSVNKRKSLPSVKLENDCPQKPLLIFGSSKSARVSAPSSSGVTTVLASDSPLQLTGWPNLDVPKVRRSKSHGQPSSNGGSNAARHRKRTGVLPSTDLNENQFRSQRDLRTESQTQSKMSQFLQVLDKKLVKPSARGFSKRISSNNRSSQSERTIHSSLKYNFAPPISIVNIDMHVDDSLSDFKKPEIIAHITVTVDVSLENIQYIPYSLAITAVILLNMTSDREMIRVTAMAQAILDKLQDSDSVVIACVNFEKEDYIDVLFSTSGICGFDLERLLSDCTSAGKQLISGAFRDDELLADAVNNSCQLFGSKSPSVPHVFLVSANRDTTLNTPYNPAVGLTTVTLEDHYELGPSPRLGWHIYPELNLDQSSSLSFEYKVEKALCHIRSGFLPGNITDLNVKFTLASGYDIQVCGRTSIASLRPGEAWKILVRANMAAERQSNRLEREIKSMLNSRNIAGTDVDRGEGILMATIRFSHSLQPGCSSRIVKTCSMVR